METSHLATEAAGTINADGQIQLGEPLPLDAAKRVRVIVLCVDDDAKINESDLLHPASTNTAFDFLNDEAEDIYTTEDGKPFMS